MQIQLKQTEIVIALKDYITKKGIDLAGKSVDIAFTASRKDAGLTADLSIDDLGIPKYSEESDHAHATAAVVSLVKTPAPEAVLAVAAEEKVVTTTILGAVANTVVTDGLEAGAAVASVKPVSLFN